MPFMLRGMNFTKSAILVVALCTSAAPCAAAESKVVQSEKHVFRLVTLVEGLTHPWSLAFLPDGRMLVTERPGRLRVVSKDFRLDPKPVEGVPQVAAVGQGGLFDVVLHPKYAENGWIYLSYAGPGAGGWSTELMRAKLDGHRLVQPQVLFRLEPNREPASTSAAASCSIARAMCISRSAIAASRNARSGWMIMRAR